MRYLLSAVACLIVLLSAAHAADVAKDPRASARAKYAKHSADALQIVEPVRISRVFGYKDGGTIGIELTDAKDKKHAFGLYSPGGAGLPERDEQPRIILNLFIGAAHPGHKGAKMVDVGGPEELALYGVLLRAIDKHKEKDAILAKEIDQKLWTARKLWGEDLLFTHDFFHRLESHFLKE
jgi:hypothetical protein